MKFYRPELLQPQDRLIVSVMEESGGITHLKAQHYDIGCVRKGITRIRNALPMGYEVHRETKQDKQGKEYTNWSFRPETETVAAA